MDQYRGNVTIVVNVATNWGLANDHYPQLQTFYEEMGDQGLSIVAFPCNQFLWQVKTAILSKNVHNKARLF